MILAVDSGTTSTRVWAVEAGEVLGEAAGRGGARDLARDRDAAWLAALVAELAGRALAGCGASWERVDAVVAFGMITSELGLEEVPHLVAPVDHAALAAGIVHRRYDGLPVPALLVPGVRSPDDAELERTDVMRGEETEVMGLLALGLVEPPLLYVSPGSHSKFIGVGAGGAIEWGLTTLSGELLWALRQETILAGLVDLERPIGDTRWVEEGAARAEAGGLSGALFGARLLNRVKGQGTAACSDFIHGAVAGSDLVALRRALAASPVALERVVVRCGTGLAEAYVHLLRSEPWAVRIEVSAAPLGVHGAWALYRSALDVRSSRGSHGSSPGGAATMREGVPPPAEP